MGSARGMSNDGNQNDENLHSYSDCNREEKISHKSVWMTTFKVPNKH